MPRLSPIHPPRRVLRFLLLPCLLATLAAALAGCSPVYDWRELSLEGGLTAWLPCKAQPIHRDVPLAGQAWPMTVRGCEAGGQSWAISQVAVADAARHEAVQQALDAALAANLAAALPRAQVPATAGLASARGLHSLELRGRRPDGTEVAASVWSFAQEGQVFQASVMRLASAGEPDPEAQEARRTFFEALRLGR